MGSLLPGWDSDPFTPPMGVGAELHEERVSLEKEMHSGGKRPSTDKFTIKTTPEAPLLARKSAPSSIIVKKLQQAFPDDDDNPILPLTAEFIDEESDEDTTPSTANSLYMRDKWWRKFSSAHLNEMANEVEKDSGKQTYTPQFGLAGGDLYIKKN